MRELWESGISSTRQARDSIKTDNNINKDLSGDFLTICVSFRHFSVVFFFCLNNNNRKIQITIEQTNKEFLND